MKENERNTNLLDRWAKLLSNRPFVAAVIFTLFLFGLEEKWFRLPQTLYLWLLPREPFWLYLGGVLSILFSLFLFLFFLWVSFLSRPVYRVIYAGILIGVILVQYNYQNVFGRFISAQDMNTALSSPFNLWVDAAAFFSWSGLLPISLYLLLTLWTWPRQQHGGRQFLAIIAVIAVSNVIYYYLGYSHSAALSVPAFFKTAGNLFIEGVEIRQLTRQLVPYKSDIVPQNNIVLIIDESIRGDRLSVNGYIRPTTPYLETLAHQGYVSNWGIAVSAATCSILSNKVILTGGSHLPDPDYHLETNPTIFQYAKAMGYTTYYLDTQTDYLWNGLTVTDLTYIDHHMTRRNFGQDYDVDLRAADFIYEQVASGTGNFFLLNKAGVHFHYNDTYPAEAIIWEPIPAPKIYVDPLAVGNTYDNGLHYNVEQFFRRLLKDTIVLEHTLLLYTSDHGQTLIENGETWSHCGNTSKEAAVPLLLIGQHNFSPDTQYRATHYNIFPTILDLMGVPAEARIVTYPLSLLEATTLDSANRYFLGGTVEAYYSVQVNFDQGEE